MTMTIANAAARIARNLPEAEQSLDAALLASTRLMESMLLARQAEGLAVYTGQSALLRLARTQRTLLTGQSDMLRVHRELLGIGREVKAIDDEDGTCPSEAVRDASVETLRLSA
ncbi:hypothetical protein MTR62_04905 [Novosphingobium sp. 1949]|uniref:Uncharacterized protein n=1 Tax=Novosphingobium organovorum TaxID=2930092 RepID=A0ABT0BAG3_9SPHN|nr:hypothetical protein [Novosphingobium organovorum]MCJ2182044.1 hypothetical protein [Novosphingobium organovorum]